MTKRIALLIAPLMAGLLSSCSLFDCENRTIHESRSPNGRWSAVLFKRACGATTADSVHLSVTDWRSLPKGEGNVLTMKTAEFLTARYWPYWRGNDRITMTVPADAKVFLRKSRTNGIRIDLIRAPRSAD